MVDNNLLVPKLRFNNYSTKSWNYFILNDLLIEKGYIRGPFGSALRRGEMKDEGVPVYEQQNAIYDNRDFRYFIDDKKFNELKRFTVKNNDLIVSCSGTVGKISLIKENDPLGIISQALLILRLNLNLINPLFLKYFFETQRGLNLLTSRAGGSSQINLAKKDVIINISIGVPELKEQNKIISFILKIDEKIDLLNQKLDQMKQFKKGLMQQIFAQKLRFDGFTDEWKVMSLKDISSIPKKEKIQTVENMKLLTVKLHVKGIEHNTTVIPKLTKKGRPYYQRFYNELLIGRQNFHNGGIGIVPKELSGGICSNAISSFIINEKIASTLFIFYYLSRKDYYKSSEKFIGGTGQKEFSEKELLKLKLNIPVLKEQNKIAECFNKIDNKINLIQSQLDQTEEFKKGLLQSLFV